VSLAVRSPLIVTVAGLVLAAPSALAGQGDTAATGAYVEANYRFVQAAVSAIHPIEAALSGVLSAEHRRVDTLALLP
jgi:hypothetical protein